MDTFRTKYSGDLSLMASPNTGLKDQLSKIMYLQQLLLSYLFFSYFFAYPILGSPEINDSISFLMNMYIHISVLFMHVQ